MPPESSFLGSPTIRIHGRDLAGESLDPELYALACRIYPGAIKEAGVSPVEMIRRAVERAREGGTSADHSNEAIVYERQRKWRDEARPTFMNGPVVEIGARLESALSAER